MPNTGEIVVTRLRMYIDGNATKTTKRNAPGDKDFVPPFIDTSTCITNADPVAPTPTPVPVPVPVPVAPTPTQCFYNSANISSTAHLDSQQACNDTTLTQAIRHDNSTASSFPATGDTVWTDCGTTAIANGFYKVDGKDQVMQIASGSVIKVSSCANVPDMPCQGKDNDVYLSAGRESLADFCGNSWSVNSTHRYTGLTTSQGLNQSICKNGQILDPDFTLYYIVSLNPTVIDADSGTFNYWQINKNGVVSETGTYNNCAESSESGSGEGGQIE